nr:MAG TPA: hypothetical protein [Caudoviricetes sp.]
MINLQLAGGSLCQLTLEAYLLFVSMREYYQRLYKR